jgi:hypothetical protein
MPPDPLPPDGVELLLAGHPHEAAGAFRRALADDPDDVHLATGLAAALAEDGDDRLDLTLADLARHALRPGLARIDRHHVEVVLLVLRGRNVRASGLGREHLVDAPDDRLVRHVLTRWCADADDLVEGCG